jgi:hypothetical protein
MRFTILLFALIPLALPVFGERQLDLPFTHQAKPRVARHAKQGRGINDFYKDMLLSNVYTHTYSLGGSELQQFNLLHQFLGRFGQLPEQL